VSIARKIIARNIIYISKLKIYKSAKRAKTHTKLLILNIRKDKLRKKELKESRDLNRYIIQYAIITY